MATSASVSLLLLALITTTILAQDYSPSPSQSPSQLPPPPPPPPPFSTTHTPLPPPFSTVPLPPLSTPPPPPTPSEIKKNQLKNILDALIGAGDFGGWANVLSSADPSAFPLTATLFIPSDDATSHYAAIAAEGKSFDPFLIPYHIIPQRLTFADLRRFATHTRLPTLLPAKFIAITNNSAANFTVDDSQITQADIFTNAAFAVHGVNNILNYTVYGGGSGSGGRDSPPPVHANPWRPKPTLEPPRKRNPLFPGEITVTVKSGAWRPCSGILMILVAIIHLHQEFS